MPAKLICKSRPDLEGLLAAQLKLAGLPEPMRQYRFHAQRRWKFDFAWPIPVKSGHAFAVEVEGGVWTRGAHTRGKRYTEDCRKYNSAALLGWVVLRFTGDQVRSGEALRTIEIALGEKT
jgi:hypothetical protein